MPATGSGVDMPREATRADRQARVEAGRQRVALMLVEWACLTAPPGPLSDGRRTALADLGASPGQIEELDRRVEAET